MKLILYDIARYPLIQALSTYPKMTKVNVWKRCVIYRSELHNYTPNKIAGIFINDNTKSSWTWILPQFHNLSERRPADIAKKVANSWNYLFFICQS